MKTRSVERKVVKTLLLLMLFAPVCFGDFLETGGMVVLEAEDYDALRADTVSGVTWESVTSTVKLAVSVVVAVPLISPVDEPSERPEGRVPDTIDQLYGVTPPVATTVSL